jgi:hypothetical protein
MRRPSSPRSPNTCTRAAPVLATPPPPARGLQEATRQPLHHGERFERYETSTPDPTCTRTEMYPLTEHEQGRGQEFAEAFIGRIPESEPWLILDGAHRFA